MAVRIKRINGKSEIFKEGDLVASMDGRAVEDQLDLIYMTSDFDEAVFALEREGRILKKKVSFEEFGKARLEFEEMQFKRCKSHCVFCFVEQMPRGLRRSLYVKDDDYRFSFLYGNYVTLNDLDEREFQRIIDYNLSPIYISVHAADRKVREKLFGRPMKHDILEILSRLTDGGITMHTQIVLVPGYNDGEVLEETVNKLFLFFPSVMSVAVVPVGLTSHREKLAPLRGVSVKEARGIVEWAKAKGSEFAAKTGGKRFLYLSDEFYLNADEELPDEDSYDGFPQLSNGVGMCRTFLNELTERIEGPLQPDINCELGIVTGVLGQKFFTRYVIPLVEEHIPKLKINLITVANELFGSSVTVSGLLSGRDIVKAIKKSDCLPLYVLPPNCVNYEGRLLDESTVEDIGKALSSTVTIPEATFLDDEVIELCRGRDKR